MPEIKWIKFIDTYDVLHNGIFTKSVLLRNSALFFAKPAE